jgi:chemotaxis protein histidine kinase CheA
MTLDPDLLDQAYHLFAEEALELLQQIQDTLLELPSDLSLIKVHRLVRAINTIESGAAQVKLPEIYNLASRLKNIFSFLWQEKIEIDPALADLLWEAYQYLRQSLLAQIQTHQEDVLTVIARAEPIFAQIEARLGHMRDKEAQLLTLERADEEDGAEWLLNEEVARSLRELETLLASDGERLEELKLQIEEFFRLGEVLNISGFVAIAQITLATLQVSPQTAQTIGQVALMGFRGIWESGASNGFSVTTKQERFSDPETTGLEQLLELDRKETTYSNEVDDSIDQNDFFVKETYKARDCLAVQSAWVFKTANSLVWLANSAAFILGCEKVKEILLLQTEQLTYFGGQPWLSWRGKNVPVYFLSQLLEYNCPTPTTAKDNLSSSQPMLVVFERDEQTVAIELAIDRLLSVPEIVIKPFGSAFSPPNYCWGCTILEGERLVIAIDLEALLDNMFDRAKNAPTILVIDDSITSRQLTVLTLQKAGYRVIQANDGQEGLQQLQQNSDVHLIISDIEMPKLNGFAFLKSCRQIPRFAKIPIILLSSYGSNRHRQMARELGAAAYICKLDNNDFLSAIDTILKR